MKAYIILGCGNYEELDSRILKLRELYFSDIQEKCVIISGNLNEAIYMKNRLYDIHNLIIDNKSYDTITNIINTWNIIPICTSYVIISSQYHIPRINYILNRLGIYNYDNYKLFRFESSLVFDNSRYDTEEYISDNINYYNNSIDYHSKHLKK